VIAKGAVLLGVNLRRFDVLWQIRQRFVEGVEPVKEKGREWAKEIVMAIPFIGSLASIGSAIGAVGAKVSPKLKGRYGELGEWLQTRLGKDYIQRLLEVLWKEPRHAEFLYLDALLEDLNGRKISEKPILFLLDQFEDVDNEKCRWRYGGREITEAELWNVFLSSLSNCVGVMASRQALPSKASEDLKIEESELTELDRDSCIELLEQRHVAEPELQERIVSVSGGNPFVIGAICDLTESADLSLDDVEDLRADTLEAVRLKTWRRLFSQAQDLLGLVEKAGLIPFFNRGILNVVAPDMRTDHWDRLVRLSFVRERGNGTWMVHTLTKELIMAELGSRLQASTDEVAILLERAAADESDYTLHGLALSVRALATEGDTITQLGFMVSDLMWRANFSDALALLDATKVNSKKGHVVIQGLRGGVLAHMFRVADGEHALREALDTIQDFGEKIPDELLVHAARTLGFLGYLLYWTGRISDAEDSYRESIERYRELAEATSGFRPQDMAWSLYLYGWLLMSVNRLDEGEKATQEALQLYKKSTPTASYDPMRGITISMRNISTALALKGRALESEEIQREVLEICREDAKRRPDNLSAARDLGVSLINLGGLLTSMGRPYEAIDLLREADHLYRGLAKKEPEALSTGVPFVLISIGLPLRQIGRYSEAEEAYLEAVDIYRELAEKAPDVFSRHIAWSLFDFAVLLGQTGRTSEAEEKCREALRIHREIAAKSPDKYKFPVSWNLNNLAVLLRQSGKLAESEEAYREAVHTARELRDEAPEAVFLIDLLATTLSNYAVLLRQTGRVAQAEEVLLEALQIRRELVQSSPEFFLHRVATTLNNLGVLLFEANRTSEAEESLREALQIRRELAEESPEIRSPSVASTLNNLGILLKRTGRISESENIYREAIDIREELASKAPTVYQRGLATTLCNYAHLLSDSNRKDTLQKTKARLNELGIKSLPKSEEWSEDEEEEANPPGPA
jgi:tetratricopeptide (TPR) repeat protein